MHKFCMYYTHFVVIRLDRTSRWHKPFVDQIQDGYHM